MLIGKQIVWHLGVTKTLLLLLIVLFTWQYSPVEAFSEAIAPHPERHKISEKHKVAKEAVPTPNELIRLAKVTRRLGHTLFVLADSPLCPLFPFAHKQLVVPARSIPYIGYIAAMSSVISFLVLELAARKRLEVGLHQEKLEQIYLENDILFNLPMMAESKK